MRSSMPKYRYIDYTGASSQSKKPGRKSNKEYYADLYERRRRKKNTEDEDEIERLRKELWPDFSCGESGKKDLQPSDIVKFSDLPISNKTLKGLNAMRISRPTEIQRESLLYALKGHDILGAAKTGSGKTLAFLIPIIETLYRLRYSPTFGMAALIIAPTRELAYQSYDVLRGLGKFHALSFGLAIGGMFLREEASRMYTTNVVICTPGRLLQHFEQTPNFTADELKVLVLDEADKILDLGFEKTLDSILEALPKQRQTLLFSATQTRSIKSLAKLSLKKPIYVSVHEKAQEVTPTTLTQRYIVCEQQDKVNMLWSFIKCHKRQKTLVFLSCCKEARYLYQAFHAINPGLTVLCLHGQMKQLQRMETYESFSRKRHVVLMATDVAARGLDFPAVDWVVQLDKPENVDTYIHRVGRTARYDKKGEALLVLLPSEEEKMVEDLKKRKIPINKLKVSKKRALTITKKLESNCASDYEMKMSAQRAFVSVMKTLYVLSRATFDQVDEDAYAASLGLIIAPDLPFVVRLRRGVRAVKESSSSDHDSKKPLDFNVGGDEDDDKDDNIYNVVRGSNAHVENDEEELKLVEVSNKAVKKGTTYKQKIRLLQQSKLITFDDDGNVQKEDEEEMRGLNIDNAMQRLQQEDLIDKEVQRKRVHEEHREKRLKAKQDKREARALKMGISLEDQKKTGAVLGNDDDDGDNEGDGPKVKRRKIKEDDSDEEDNSSDQDSDDDDDDDDDEEDDESADGSEEDEDDEEDEDEGGRPENLEQDEAAVLALLGGKI